MPGAIELTPVKQVAYAIRLDPAFYGGYFASCRDLPSVRAHGDNPRETVRRVSEMMDLVLMILIDEDQKLPVPTEPSMGEILVAPSSHVQSIVCQHFARMP